jgi:hypothetical protein
MAFEASRSIGVKDSLTIIGVETVWNLKKMGGMMFVVQL